MESFDGKLRDELLAREVFDILLEAKVLVERWRRPRTPSARMPTGRGIVQLATIPDSEHRDGGTDS